jgi:mannobiose 2-epimerase
MSRATIDQPSLATYAADVRRELVENILPFYQTTALDSERGGFHGYVDADGVSRPSAPKGVVQVTRILWAFARAARQLADPTLLDTAARAYDALRRYFLDPQYGGLYWMVDANGAPLHTRKMVYAQAFGIYALAEYARAIGEAEPLDLARDIFARVETRAFDADRGGYIEGCGRNWYPVPGLRVDEVEGPVVFSMNTHLHLMEAYTTLLSTDSDTRANTVVRDALRRCLRITLDRIVNRQTGHFALQFDATWRPLDDRVSYGHDIEGSWLLVEAAEALGEAALLDEARAVALRMAQSTLAEGRDTDGAIVNEGGPGGVRERSKDWWPQAEAMVGFLNAWQLTGNAAYLDASLASWRFIQDRLIDRAHGEWHWGLDAAGQLVSQQKTGPWKGPYHNGRACMEVMQRAEKERREESR